jgi:L-ascorbate metabolism protein UlaG (beta-lactamase superfamily)
MPDTHAAVEDIPATNLRSLSMAYLGHSTVLIDIDGTRVLTDPILRRRVGPLVRVGDSVDPSAWTDVDLVLISHSHWDHLDYGSLRLLGHTTPMVVPRGMGARLRARGFGEVIEVVPGDELTVAGLAIEATHARHRGFGPPIGPTELCVGYLATGSRSVYFAGDTALFEEMAALDRGISLALIPVWGWGPRARAPEHLDPLGAAHAVRLVRPRIAVPIHWGTLHPIGLGRMRPRTRIDPPHQFARMAADMAPDTIVRVVPVGGSLSLDGDLTDD